MSKITFAQDAPTPLTRKDLKPGTVFTYAHESVGRLQLFIVPEPAFNRHPNISEKDIPIGGSGSGGLDDWKPSIPVIVCDLVVSKSETQPQPLPQSAPVGRALV